MLNPKVALTFKASIIGVGVVSIVSQVALFREIFSLLEGNELVISIAMFMWLFCGGLGSLLAKICPAKKGLYLALTCLSGISPAYIIFLARFLHAKFYTLGLSPGLWESFMFFALTMAPYSTMIGFLLPYSQKVSALSGPPLAANRVYVLDNLGDMGGAVLVSVLLLAGIQMISITLVAGLGLLLPVSLLAIQIYGYRGLVSLLLLLCLLFLPSKLELDYKSILYNYPGLVHYQDSIYGRIAVTSSKGEITIWESGTPYLVSADIITAEEKVHYPLSQVQNVDNILLISGFSKETMEELAKYAPSTVEYVELDPSIIEVAKKYQMIKAPTWLKIFSTDAKKFVDMAKTRYDAIILDLPTPDTFQLSRIYSEEFFTKVRKILKSNGVFSFSIEYNYNYLSPHERELVDILISTVKAAFSNYLIIPGNKLYFIASENDLNLDIPAILKKKRIKTKYVEDYFYGNVTKERIDFIMQNVKGLKSNKVLENKVMKVALLNWFSKVGVNFRIVFLFSCIMVFVCFLVFVKSREIVIFSTGFLIMGMEIVVLFLFQIVYGYVYVGLSLVIASFLFGLFPGALMGARMKNGLKAMLLATEFILLFMTVTLLWAMVKGQYEWEVFVFLSFSFILSLWAGMQFSILATLCSQAIPYRLFGADLIGASLGVVLVGGFIAPFLGMVEAAFCLMLVKLVSIIGLLWQRA